MDASQLPEAVKKLGRANFAISGIMGLARLRLLFAHSVGGADMFNFILGIFAGLAVGLALEWMIDWPALRRKQEKRGVSTLRSEDPKNGAAPESGDESPAAEG